MVVDFLNVMAFFQANLHGGAYNNSSIKTKTLLYEVLKYLKSHHNLLCHWQIIEKDILESN